MTTSSVTKQRTVRAPFATDLKKSTPKKDSDMANVATPTSDKKPSSPFTLYGQIPARNKEFAPSFAGSSRPSIFSRKASAKWDAKASISSAIFSSLDTSGCGLVSGRRLRVALFDCGLFKDDARLRSLWRKWKDAGADGADLTPEDFADICDECSVLVSKALAGRLIVPDFKAFCDDITDIFNETKQHEGGEVASYIPELASVDPDQYGVAICTVDGQRFGVGDFQTDFCIQSCCKPLTYLMAVHEHGLDKVHEHIGREPSGQEFNKLSLLTRAHHDGSSNAPKAVPHNPMINSGAIMSHALIKPQAPMSQRFGHIMKTWKRLCGQRKAGFANSTYLSEKDTADRNFCLGYMMREMNAFPENTNLRDTLELYFQSCSIEMDADKMSVVAATLANGGMCPMTEDRIFKPQDVRNCLSLMLSCGMYTFSGEWAFSIGLPAKSGVGGAVFMVVPSVLGICVWSPRLDLHGNSVRGVAFCRKMLERFNFHHLDGLPGVVSSHSQKKDPRKKRDQTRQDDISALLYAAMEGDVKEAQRLDAQGVDMGMADYDARTALHLAACEKHLDMISFLLDHNADPSVVDRWGNSPLDDALRESGANCRVVKFLRARGALTGDEMRQQEQELDDEESLAPYKPGGH